MTVPAPSLRSAVYGTTPDLDDPAELFHESSRLYPSLVERQAEGIVRLAGSPALLEASTRAARRNRQLVSSRLDAEARPSVSLWEAIERRASAAPAAGDGGLARSDLAQLLLAGYGPTRPGRRAVPSGGALYPLELYVIAERVRDLQPGIYHLDPLTPALERLPRPLRRDDLLTAAPSPEPLEHATAVLVITSVFWRTRLKYGLRGYRFALLEAGHVAQNVLLAAAALGVTALPLGGFYDAKVDDLLGADGVDEASLYAIVVGGRSS